MPTPLPVKADILPSMKILLIGNEGPHTDPSAYYDQYKAFFERAITHSQSDHSFQYTLIDDLMIAVGDGQFTIYDTRNKADLANYQLIIIRGEGFRLMFGVLKAISSYAKQHSISVINDYSAFRDSSKLTQAVQFFETGLPVACTVFVTPAVLAGKAPLGFELPCIMKAVFGSH